MSDVFVSEIRMTCVSEEAAERVGGYDPHLAGDTVHTAVPDGDSVEIRYADPAWPLSVAESAREEGFITAAEAARIVQHARSSASVPALAEETTGGSDARELLLLALLNLAPEFEVPCRPGGSLRDITVSRHRTGPDAPWTWAVHRMGPGLISYTWDGSGWMALGTRAQMIQRAIWKNPLHAIAEAQRVAAADVIRGRTEVEHFAD